MSAKYIIHADIQIDGVVDRPDVIGAVFGQTEGLLGSELELRELQKSGRIGRIEVTTEVKGGKTFGTIVIPSSLDKAETAIIAASLEVIQRIGPCNAKVTVSNIEDVRVSKRKFVVERAKQLLRQLIENVMPDSQELSDEVAYSVRVMEVREYGKERLSAGPMIEDSDEIIVVEGRADVLNLLKYGFKNAIAVGGTNVPKTVLDLCKEKTVTVFVDGDRGGDLIIKELMNSTEIDYVTKAPDGKEVEELTKKEIHKALRSKVASEQAHLESASTETRSSRPVRQTNSQYNNNRAPRRDERNGNSRRPTQERSAPRAQPTKKPVTDAEKKTFNKMLEDLIGTRGACILDNSLNILGKIPTSELATTIKSLNNTVYAVVFDGNVTTDLVVIADKNNVKFLIGMGGKVNANGRTRVLTPEDLS